MYKLHANILDVTAIAVDFLIFWEIIVMEIMCYPWLS